jgi:hypothetical protein
MSSFNNLRKQKQTAQIYKDKRFPNYLNHLAAARFAQLVIDYLMSLAKCLNKKYLFLEVTIFIKFYSVSEKINT